MSVIYEYFDIKERDEEKFLLPTSPYCHLFGWIAEYGKAYSVENFAEEENLDGEDYSQKTNGAAEKFFPLHLFCFDDILDYPVVNEYIKLMNAAPEKRVIKTAIEPSEESKRIAKIKGTYKQYMSDYKEALEFVEELNEKNLIEVVEEYNYYLNKAFSLVYPSLGELPVFPICRDDREAAKQLKIFKKHVKKLLPEIEKINRIRGARLFLRYDEEQLAALPEDICEWMIKSFKKYKKSDFIDQAWL